MGIVTIVFRHYIIFLRSGNGPPFRIFHTLNLKSFELKNGVLKGDNDELPYEMLGKGTCLVGENNILVLGMKNNPRSSSANMVVNPCLYMDLFWLTVDEDSETLGISFELLPVDQDSRPNFTRVFGSFVKKKNFYVFGIDNRFPENLWQFNSNCQSWNRLIVKGDGPNLNGVITCTYHNNRLYLAEGASAGSQADLWMLDTESLIWIKIKPEGDKIPRIGYCTLREHGDKLYLYGREGDRVNATAFYEYNLGLG